MPQRRKHPRTRLHLPAMCRIRNKKNEIVISSAGKTNNLSLGGLNITLPVRLIMIRARLIEYTVELPEPFQPLQGKGVIRWGYWDEKEWQTTFGLEMNSLPEEQLQELENFMADLGGDEQTPFFHSLNN